MNHNLKFGEVHQLKESIDYSSGATVSKIVTKNKCGSITLFSFDKGQNLSEHTTSFDALVHVCDGTAELIIGGEKIRVSSGQFCIMPAKIPHTVNAPEKFKMILSLIRT